MLRQVFSVASAGLSRSFATAAAGAKKAAPKAAAAASAKTEVALEDDVFTQRHSVKVPLNIPTKAGGFATKGFAVAAQNNQLEAVQSELTDLTKAFKENAAFRAALLMQSESPVAREQNVVAMLEKVGVSPLVRKFIGWIARQGAPETLPAVSEAFDKLISAHKREAKATITVSKPEDPMTLDQIQEYTRLALPQYKKILFNVQVNPSIEGGFIVSGDGFRIDMSLATTSNSFKKILQNV